MKVDGKSSVLRHLVNLGKTGIVFNFYLLKWLSIHSFICFSGKPDTPGVYTRVSTYNNFIRSSIRLSRQANFYYSSARQYSLKDLFIVNIMAIVFLLLWILICMLSSFVFFFLHRFQNRLRKRSWYTWNYEIDVYHRIDLFDQTSEKRENAIFISSEALELHRWS